MDSTTIILLIVGVLIFGICIFSFRFSNGGGASEEEISHEEEIPK